MHRRNSGGALRVLAGLSLFLSGCTVPALNTARTAFFAGRFEAAGESLAELPEKDKDKVLYLMERGLIAQTAGNHETAIQDWRNAAELVEQLETHSVSEGAASLVVNDRTISFRGAPHERVLLYSFLAKSYLAMHNWAFAGVAARNIIWLLENRDGFPDDAYSRYVAGLCLELTGDPGNAAIQYERASELVPSVEVAPRTGLLSGVNTNEPARAGVALAPRSEAELVCFILIGHTPTGEYAGMQQTDWEQTPYAQIVHNGTLLGRSRALANLADLIRDTEARVAMLRTTKTITRVVIKETLAASLQDDNPLLAELLRVILFSLEEPDTRRWETLPLWLGVARVACPADLHSFDVLFRWPNGAPRSQVTVTAPIVRRGRVFVAVCRDLLPQELPAQSPP